MGNTSYTQPTRRIRKLPANPNQSLVLKQLKLIKINIRIITDYVSTGVCAKIFTGFLCLRGYILPLG
jgi:hypothetical protein